MTKTQNSTARDRLDAIHAEIRDRICGLDYPPGKRLSEVALAEEFDVSRTPLRRVLARLEDEGLVQSVHGVGTLVTDVDPRELGQVYRLRQELVLLYARLDPVPVTDAVIDWFRALNTRAMALKSTPSARAFAQLDSDMFLALLDLTDNAPLREISERLYFRTARIWIQQVTASRLDLMQEIEIYANETAQIVAALEARDLDAVGHLRHAHISLSFSRFQVD